MNYELPTNTFVVGGQFDPAMVPLAQALSVPLIAMHMRGTPQTMTSKANVTYAQVGAEVAGELSRLSLTPAQALGIPRWMQLVDPGVGFAKTAEDSARLVHPGTLRSLRLALGRRYMMLGTSRKRFLAAILKSLATAGADAASASSAPSSSSPVDRDFATIGSCLAALQSNSLTGSEAPGEETDAATTDLGPLILRVHNVRAVAEAAHIYTHLLSITPLSN